MSVEFAFLFNTIIFYKFKFISSLFTNYATRQLSKLKQDDFYSLKTFKAPELMLFDTV